MSASGALSAGTVSLGVKPDATGFGAKLAEGVKAESGGLAEVGKNLGGALMAGLGTIGIAVGVGEFIKKGVEEYSAADALNAQFAAGIKSTGNAANLSVAGMDDLAKSISGYSGQAYDSIGKTEQVLQTFANIKNVGPDKIFDDATTAAANMAAKLGGDASSSAIQLGKALNDPVQGMTALRRVGVAFTASQTDQVKAMVASGDTMGAQKVILAELTKEFGGAAKAAGETLPGEINRMHVAFGELSKGVLTGIMPVVAPAIGMIADAVNKALPGIEAFGEKVSEGMQVVVDAFHGASAGADLGPLTKPLEAIGTVAKEALNILGSVFKSIGPIVAPLIPQFLQLATSFSPFGLVLKALQPVLPQFAAVLKEVGGILGSTFKEALPIVTSLVTELAGVLSKVFAAILPVIATLLKTLAPIFAALLPPIMQVVGVLADILGPVLQIVGVLLVGLVHILLPILVPAIQILGAIITVVFQAIGNIVTWLWTAIIQPVVNFIIAYFQALSVVVTWLYVNIIQPTFAAIGAVFLWVWNSVISPVVGFISTAVNIVGSVFSNVFGAVGGIIRGAFNGVVDFVRGIFNSIIGVVNGIIDGINGATSMAGAIGIHIGAIPHLPRLAEGATVLPKPGGTPVVLAEAGRAETVVDTGKLNRMLDQVNSRGGKGDIMPNATIYMTPDKTPAEYAQEMAWYARTNS